MTNKSVSKELKRKHPTSPIITEIYKIDEIRKKVFDSLDSGFKKEDILIILDLDETLIQSYLEDQGHKKYITAKGLFGYLISTILKKNVPPDIAKHIKNQTYTISGPIQKLVDPLVMRTAYERAQNIFNILYNQHVKTETIEQGTSDLVKQLQLDGIKVMAFTARGMDIVECTHKHLQATNITFNYNTISDKHIIFRKINRFEQGILFLTPLSVRIDKGEMLYQFFKKIGYHPKNILFVDDRFSFLEDVGNMLITNYSGVQFEGLWYLNTVKTNFDYDLIHRLICKHVGKDWCSLE